MYRVLLVDDDPTILHLLAKIVSSRGWEPLLARSGQEALSWLNRADVDVVVTDFSMPGMDGLEVLGAIRERDDAPPVIMVTGHCSERLFELAVDAGAYRCLGKPFELAKLTEAIASALAVARAGRHSWPDRGAAGELPRGRAAGTR
jgi:two-component system, NtrC family, response regulator